MHASPLTRGCLIAIVVSGGALVGCGLDQATVQIQVVDRLTGGTVPGAAVEIDGYRRMATNQLGIAQTMLRPGAYGVSVSAPRYASFAGTVSVFSGTTNQVRFALDPATPGPSPAPGASPSPGVSPSPGASAPPGPKPSASPTPAADQTVTLFGKVTDPTGVRLGNATVYVESDFGVPFGQPATTNAVGEYKLVCKVPKGTTVRASAMADNYQTRTRYITPSGTWRMDFSGPFALSAVVADPDQQPFETVSGRVEDTMGRTLKWGIVKVETDGVRYPFNASTLVLNGRYEITVPTRLPLRFTASAPNHRNVTLTQSVNGASDRQIDFTGYRALDPTPILEGASVDTP